MATSQLKRLISCLISCFYTAFSNQDCIFVSPLLFSILAVTGRCIPLLTNMTTDSVMFSNSVVRQFTIPIEDIVNGTISLAQLLNAGQVKRKTL